MFSRFRVPVCVAIVFACTCLDAQPPGRQRGGPSLGRRGPNGLVFLVSLTEVQKELEVNSQQESLLELLVSDIRQQQRNVFARGFRRSADGNGGPENDFQKELGNLNRNIEKMLATVFEPEQSTRLNQLRLQFEGVQALEREEVAEALGLSDGQQADIREVREGYANPEELPDVGAEQQLENDVLAILSGEQKQKWVEMKGDQFEFPDLSRRFGRGFRNRR